MLWIFLDRWAARLGSKLWILQEICTFVLNYLKLIFLTIWLFGRYCKSCFFKFACQSVRHGGKELITKIRSKVIKRAKDSGNYTCVIRQALLNRFFSLDNYSELWVCGKCGCRNLTSDECLLDCRGQGWDWWCALDIWCPSYAEDLPWPDCEGAFWMPNGSTQVCAATWQKACAWLRRSEAKSREETLRFLGTWLILDKEAVQMPQIAGRPCCFWQSCLRWKLKKNGRMTVCWTWDMFSVSIWFTMTIDPLPFTVQLVETLFSTQVQLPTFFHTGLKINSAALASFSGSFRFV